MRLSRLGPPPDLRAAIHTAPQAKQRRIAVCSAVAGRAILSLPRDIRHIMPRASTRRKSCRGVEVKSVHILCQAIISKLLCLVFSKAAAWLAAVRGAQTALLRPEERIRHSSPLPEQRITQSAFTCGFNIQISSHRGGPRG